MMKILQCVDRIRLEEGGVVRAVLDLSGALAQRGHDVKLLTWDATDAPVSWRKGEARCPKVIEIEAPAMPGGLYTRRQLRRLGPLIASTHVLHLHTPWDRTNAQLGALARRLGQPYILSVHGMLDDWCMAAKGLKKRLYLAVAGRRFLDGASAVHCTAEAEWAQVSRRIPKARGVVIPLVFDLEPFKSLPGPEAASEKFLAGDGQTPVVLFLSRLHQKKRPEVLIEAAALLKERGCDCRVLVAGTGEEVYVLELKRLVVRLGLGEQVSFLGMVAGNDKLSLYQRAQVMALPTSQENFGFVAPEAMACETPVVTTRGVDIWPELEASGGAMIVEPTPDAFADAIQPLLADQSRCEQMGGRGRSWVFEELDGERVVERFEAMYIEATHDAEAGADRERGS